ncbi:MULTISPECIES: stage III sporulation protein AE [Allobacillus]|uniref:Stage III sporulation protein AE n=1 Tax=Allobacillus halotolerans TaxID=570278 RepID=A0ABS6GK97_9BACI|nr:MULTISPECIES: stage III sporulation protein AE [Allobacillus]MBU6079624.1 stage III sporulation protein AE [Allobacillus halotolerans]TSJ68929.1 stage III sporulation protein AE [Allobacillus sp. SKP2-8]
MRFFVAFSVVVFMILAFIPVHATAEEQQMDLEMDEQWIDTEEIQVYWQDALRQYREFIPLSADEHWLDAVKDGSIFSIKDWFNGFLLFFLEEWRTNGKLIGMLFLLSLLSVFLKILVGSFENSSVSKISYLVIFGVLLTVAISSFYQAVNYTTETIESLSHFMFALLPLMLSLMASFGNVATVAFFQPLILVFTQVSGVLISKLVLPLLFISAILHIASFVNEEFNVSRLADLFKYVAFVIMGAFLTLFVSLMSLQGVNAAVTDGVAIRAAKYVTSNFIPVIGRMFTDATDTVLSASILLKNSIGIAGVIIILLITLFPVIKVLVIGLIFKVTSAVLQPIADGPVVDLIDVMGKYILYILVALLLMSLMFFFAIVMLIIVSNMTLMIR